MLTSTFTALRAQGVPIRALRHAAKLNFGATALASQGPNDGPPCHATQDFWTEVISARRAYREKTGHNIEDILSA
jgi:hypothetical protein